MARDTPPTCATRTARPRSGWARATPSPFRRTGSGPSRSCTSSRTRIWFCIRRARDSRGRCRCRVSVCVGATRFLPDGRRLLIGADEEGRGDRVYLVDVEGGKPRAVTPENFRGPGPISTDGKRFLARGPDEKVYILSDRGRRADADPGVRSRATSPWAGQPTIEPSSSSAAEVPGRGSIGSIWRRDAGSLAGDPALGRGGSRSDLLGLRLAGWDVLRLRLLARALESLSRRGFEVTLSAGAKLGPYEIVAPLGAGGMGEVYRAKDARLEREVAVKVLPAAFLRDADRLARLRAGGAAAAALNHPNIVAIYDIGNPRRPRPPRTSCRSCSKGRRCARRSRAGSCRRERRSTSRSQIAHGLASGAREGDRPPGPEAREPLRHEGRPRQDPRFRAGEAHAHRGRAGRSRTCRRPSAGTEPGVVMGTLGYMSPEQVKGKPPTPGRTSSPSARSSTRCSRAGERSTATRRPRRCRRSCGKSRRTFRPRTRASRPVSSGSCGTASRRIPSSGSTRRTTSPSSSRRPWASRALRKSPRRRRNGAGPPFAWRLPSAPPQPPSAWGSFSAAGFARRRRRNFGGSPITAVTSSPPGSLRTD